VLRPSKAIFPWTMGTPFHVIAALGFNRRAPGSRHMANGRLLAPDCTLTGSQMHPVPHPKPPNREKRLRFRSILDCVSVLGGWEKSSGKSQLNWLREPGHLPLRP
jgi:hypothetical protein